MIDTRKLEAVADAVAHYSGYLKPESPLYAGRNPGGLKAFSARHAKDAEGFRTFHSVLDGMQALIFDVELKLTGKSRAALTPDHTLTDFAAAFEKTAAEARAWAAFLRQALRDTTITQKTQIRYFLETPDGR